MGLGPDNLDVYRLSISSVAGVYEKADGTEPVNVGPDFDSDFDPAEEKPQGGGGDGIPAPHR